MSLPEGMAPEKLEKIADYVSLLDRMELDPDLTTLTVRKGPRPGESEMQDSLRAWAAWIRREQTALPPDSPFPGDALQLDLLTVIGRLQQVEDEGGFDAADEIVTDRLLTCDLPRLRRYLTPAVVAWAEREEAL